MEYRINHQHKLRLAEELGEVMARHNIPLVDRDRILLEVAVIARANLLEVEQPDASADGLGYQVARWSAEHTLRQVDRLYSDQLTFWGTFKWKSGEREESHAWPFGHTEDLDYPPLGPVFTGVQADIADLIEHLGEELEGSEFDELVTAAELEAGEAAEQGTDAPGDSRETAWFKLCQYVADGIRMQHDDDQLEQLVEGPLTEWMTKQGRAV